MSATPHRFSDARGSVGSTNAYHYRQERIQSYHSLRRVTDERCEQHDGFNILRETYLAALLAVLLFD